MMKALLIVSFGSSSIKGGISTLELIYETIQQSFLERRIYKAFTSQKICSILWKQNIYVETIQQVMPRIIEDGVDDLIIYPNFMIEGQSYKEMYQEVMQYQKYFKRFLISPVLLHTLEDALHVLKAFRNSIGTIYPFEAIIGMGHGSECIVSQSYHQLNTLLKDHFLESPIFIATLTATPNLNEMIAMIKKGDYHAVRLIPFTLLSGYHAVQDMQKQWVPMLQQKGFKVTTVMQSLGEIPEIRTLMIEHIKALPY